MISIHFFSFVHFCSVPGLLHAEYQLFMVALEKTKDDPSHFTDEGTEASEMFSTLSKAM